MGERELEGEFVFEVCDEFEDRVNTFDSSPAEVVLLVSTEVSFCNAVANSTFEVLRLRKLLALTKRLSFPFAL